MQNGSTLKKLWITELICFYRNKMLIRHIKILIECKTQQIGPTSTFITQELLSIHTEIKKYKYFNVYNYCCSQAVVSSDSE